MVWIVLPRPISSARMPFVPARYSDASQLSPACWYERRVPRSRTGCGTRCCPASGEDDRDVAVAAEEGSTSSSSIFALSCNESCLLCSSTGSSAPGSASSAGPSRSSPSALVVGVGKPAHFFTSSLNRLSKEFFATDCSSPLPISASSSSSTSLAPSSVLLVSSSES